MAGRKHDAKPGDLIEFSRCQSQGLTGLYQHWAVYIGNDEVVHVTLPEHNSTATLMTLMESTRATVTRENIWKAADTSDFTVNNFLDKKHDPLNPDEIVAKACKMVGQDWDYNLATHNCEHFATGMRYGIEQSRQVKQVVMVTVASATATAATVVIVYIIWRTKSCSII